MLKMFHEACPTAREKRAMEKRECTCGGGPNKI